MIFKSQKYLVFILIASLLFSCSESINDSIIENQVPETHLFLNTDENLSQQKSKLTVHWWGDDPDGLVKGFLIKWEGIDENWSFTTSNDSTFSLPIGTADTNYTFYVAAVDDNGNGKYDSEVVINEQIKISEPFTDLNKNGVYDKGEDFIDLGAIDNTPSSQTFPIRNSSPIIWWNELSQLPEVSFPAITVGWNATDLDGDETISQIYLALNDTIEYVTLDGNTRLISLIVDDLNSEDPQMNIYINADESKLYQDKLSNLKLNDNNTIYVKSIDNSGASSSFVPLPDTSRNWFVAKPKGEILIIDDFPGSTEQNDFYTEKFNQFGQNKFDVFDLESQQLPYRSITFLNTLKLFGYVFWYSSSTPSLELANVVTQKYLQSGGKIAYSMTFQDSSSSFEFSLSMAQTFLPIDEFDSESSLPFMFAGANIIPKLNFNSFPTLSTSTTIGFVRTFKVNEITSQGVYDLTSSQLNGEIALMNNTKNLFFIGLPLFRCDENNNVGTLLEEIFVNEFGFIR